MAEGRASEQPQSTPQTGPEHAAGIGAAPPGGAGLGRAAILTTVTLWAFQVPAMHVLGARWDVASLNLIRYLIALTAFTALSTIWRTARPRIEARWQAALLGALFAGFGILYTVAATIGDPASLVTAVALSPLTASLVNWVLLGVLPRWRVLAALVVVIPGAILATPAGEESAGSHPVTAIVLIIAAQVLWSLYSLLLHRWLPLATAFERTAMSVRWSMPCHLAVFAAMLLLGGVRIEWQVAPLMDAGLIVAAALGPLVIGVQFWNLSVIRIGLPATALYLNLIPVIGLAIAAAFGVPPTLVQCAGAAMVVSGMVFAQAPMRPLPV